MQIFARLKRSLWLLRSAGLTPRELLVVGINKCILFFTKRYYWLRSLKFGGRTNTVYGYSRYLGGPLRQPKRALVSYLAEASFRENFIGRNKYYFSNTGAPLSINRALNELGYVVDVVQANDTSFLPQRQYDLFMFHDFYIYDLITPHLPKHATKIFLDVTAYWRFAVRQINERLAGFAERHGVALPEKDFNFFLRIARQGDSADRIIRDSDGILVIGDQLANSYRDFPLVCKTTNGCYEDRYFTKELTDSSLDKNRKNFLFFGGGVDTIRKGLDVLLDAFIGSPYQLYFCSEIHPEFERIFQLSRQPNIHPLGYLKQGSEKFYDIISRCNYVIQPSCTEGIPGGVLDTMKYGLIPVVSKECNILPEDFAHLISDAASVSSVKSAVETIAAKPSSELLLQATSARQKAKSEYSPQAFIEDVKKGIVRIVDLNR